MSSVGFGRLALMPVGTGGERQVPYTDETAELLDRVNQALRGTPYQFPADDVSRQRLVALRERVDHLDELCIQMRDNLQSLVRFGTPLRSMHRTQEVYESNAIEGVGLSARATQEVISAVPASAEATASTYAEWALTEGLSRDRHTYEVIGLDAARSLAREVAAHSERSVLESDIRAIHQIVMGDDDRAGRYKRYHVTIAGSAHEPPAPIDTPEHMARLVEWFNQDGSGDGGLVPALVRASAVHAWFAHVHPFEDGNGRLARLLANMALVGEGLPPLIVRNQMDRPRYIDALGASDQAGDLSRLIAVFARCLERTALDYVDPEFARRAFERDLGTREAGDHAWWGAVFDQAMSELAGKLLLAGIRFERVGFLSAGDFEYLRHRRVQGNSWIAKLHGREGSEGLLWVGYTPSRLADRLEPDQIYPTIMLSRHDARGGAAHPYTTVWQLPGLRSQFMVEPPNQVWCVSARGVETHPLSVGVQHLAESIQAMMAASNFDVLFARP
jgi:Fic family protein